MAESSAELSRDLGGGLVLRRARPADADAIERHNAWHLRDDDATEPDRRIGLWTRDLATRPHPTFRVDDFTVVEDTRTGQIVSSMALIPQTWTYAGVPIPVGRPEIVSTHPDYQRRGLVRAQFELVHQLSAARGDLLNVITGIPNFYRQFGYEMCVALWTGRSGHRSRVGKPPADRPDPYSFRPATEADIPLLIGLSEHGASRSVLACKRDEATWRYELSGRDPGSLMRREFRIVEASNGDAVGFIAHEPGLGGPGHSCVLLLDYELLPGASWVAVSPSVVRYLVSLGESLAAAIDGARFEYVNCVLGPEHPMYEAAGGLLPDQIWPYAWYMRVPNWVDFLTAVAPALEKRLADSVVAGHSGDLKINSYRAGVRIVLERGRIVGVSEWRPTQKEWGHAKFPDLTFLQVLFGHRSIEELEYAFADVGIRDDESRCLLKALFPKRSSNVWGLG